MTNTDSSSPLSVSSNSNTSTSTCCHHSTLQTKRRPICSHRRRVDQKRLPSKSRPLVSCEFVDIVRSKLLSIGEPASYPDSDSIDSNETKLCADPSLGRIRKSGKIPNPQTPTTPICLTPDSFRAKPASLYSPFLYENHLNATGHEHKSSLTMEDVATAKYLNEREIFALDYNASSKAVDNQVFQMCRDDCDITPLRLSCSGTVSNLANRHIIGGGGAGVGNGGGGGSRNLWSGGGVIGSGVGGGGRDCPGNGGGAGNGRRINNNNNNSNNNNNNNGGSSNSSTNGGGGGGNAGTGGGTGNSNGIGAHASSSGSGNGGSAGVGGGAGVSCGGGSGGENGGGGGGTGGGGGHGGRAGRGGNAGCSGAGAGEPCSSYSDNEKQLIEEIKRIKREHEHVLRTYEDRISRMTDKMHELRNIAEMLENSSNKSQPYGVIPAKVTQTGKNGSSNNNHDNNNNNNNNNNNTNNLNNNKNNTLTNNNNDNIINNGHSHHHLHFNHHNNRHRHHHHHQQSVPCHTPGHCVDPETRSSNQNLDKIVPPPLPPRNDRGTAKVYPNKPLIHTKVKLTQVPWTRIITNPDDENMKSTIWNTIGETDIDTQEIERFFEESPTKSTVFIQSLYDDVSLRCGTLKPQPISIIGVTKCQQMTQQMKQVRCTFSDVVHALLTLSIETLRFANSESLSELFHLMSSGNDIEIIAQQDRRISNVQMDCPEYFLYELSGMEMLRERLDFLRFKLRFLTDLFETDQKLRSVNAACDELYNNLPLKNLLEVMVCIGNYMNGGTPLGQADGFQLDILPKLKDILAKNNKSNFLVYAVTVYCQKFENEPGLQTNRTFRLPNAVVVRYASQISFDEMQKNLQSWKNELINTRNKIHSNLAVSTSRQVEGFRNAVEYFLSAGMETMEEQKRFLYDTRDYCHKLLSYFSFELNGRGSIQRFFFMWSQFLHECKHCWKISHQRLAEERFRKGLNQKIKMMNIATLDKFSIPSSCPDLPPRIRKQKPSSDKTHLPPPITIPQKKWEDGSNEHLNFHHIGTSSPNHLNDDNGGNFHHLHHHHHHHHHHHSNSNSLPTSGQCNNNETHSHHLKTYKSREDLHDFQAQPSPKPLTSRPPNNSDIHKPKPLNAVPTSHEGSPLLGMTHRAPVSTTVSIHNYMNQSPLVVLSTNPPVVAASGTTTNPLEVAEVAPKRPPPHHAHLHQTNTQATREAAGVAAPSTTATPMVTGVNSGSSNNGHHHHHHHSSSTATSLTSGGGGGSSGAVCINTGSKISTTAVGHTESTAQKKSTHQLFKSWLKREQTKPTISEQSALSSKSNSNEKSKVTAFKPVVHGSEESVRAPKIYTRAKSMTQAPTSDVRDGHHGSHDQTSSGAASSKNGTTSRGQDTTEPKQLASHSGHNRIGVKEHLYSPRYEQSPMSSSEMLSTEKKSSIGEQKSQQISTSRNHYQHFSGVPSPQKSVSDPGSINGEHMPHSSSLTSSGSSNRNYENDIDLITSSSIAPTTATLKSYTTNNHTNHFNKSNSNSANKHRDRMPIVLDSNAVISDINRPEILSKNPADSNSSDRTVEKISCQTLPTAQTPSKSNSTTVSSMGSYAHEIQAKSRKYFTTNAAQQSTINNMSGVIGCRSQSSNILKNLSGVPSDPRGGVVMGGSLPSGANLSSSAGSGQHRSSSAYSYSQKVAREEAAAAAVSPRTGYHTEGRASKLAGSNNERLPTSAPSIGSLIERFEKVQHVGDSSVKNASKPNEAKDCDMKHIALASTPVSSRKRLFGEPPAATATTNQSTKTNAEDSSSSDDEYAVQIDRAVSPIQKADPDDISKRHNHASDRTHEKKPTQNEHACSNGENSNCLPRGSYQVDAYHPTNDYSFQFRETSKSSNILTERYSNIPQTPERPPPLTNQKGHNKRVIRAHENMAYMAV